MKKVVLFACMFSAADIVFAQSAYSGLSVINKIIMNTPGITSVSVAGSTTVSAAASEAAALANGLRIPVATTATAAVTSGRLAGLAAGAMKAGTGIGLASIILPILWDKSGYKVCPPPQFVCKATTEPKEAAIGGWYSSNTSGTYSTGQGVCNARATALNQGFALSFTVDATGKNGVCKNSTAGSQTFGTTYDYPLTSSPANCPSGSTLMADSTCRSDTKTINIVAADISTSLKTEMDASASKQQQVYDASRNANLPNIISGADTVTVSAPQVSSPSIVRTESILNADGTTSTKTTTTTTTINPSVQGTTVNNTTINYPASTTTTTNVTNNSTNVTNNSSMSETQQAKADAPLIQQPNLPTIAQAPAPEMPTDYNREVTQQAILKSLDGSGVPSSSTVDKDADIAKINTQNGLANTAMANITPESVGLFNWFPTIPTASCSNPKVPNPLTHALVDVPICDPVNIFSKFISAVMCVFALYGSVRCVQDAIKA